MERREWEWKVLGLCKSGEMRKDSGKRGLIVLQLVFAICRPVKCIVLQGGRQIKKEIAYSGYMLVSSTRTPGNGTMGQERGNGVFGGAQRKGPVKVRKVRFLCPALSLHLNTLQLQSLWPLMPRGISSACPCHDSTNVLATTLVTFEHAGSHTCECSGTCSGSGPTRVNDRSQTGCPSTFANP